MLSCLLFLGNMDNWLYCIASRLTKAIDRVVLEETEKEKGVQVDAKKDLLEISV